MFTRSLALMAFVAKSKERRPARLAGRLLSVFATGIIGVLLFMPGCTATPKDVLVEADGVPGMPGSEVVERGLAAVGIYTVYANQAVAILRTPETPLAVGQAIIRADTVIGNVVLRAEPLILELQTMVTELGVDPDNTERFRYLMCNVPQLTDSIGRGLPELKSAIATAGEKVDSIPSIVTTLAGQALDGYCVAPST